MRDSSLTVTAVGWVATAPRQVVGDRVPFTFFRMACTERRFDAGRAEWADGRTEWLTVKAFRDAAHNVATSLRKGDAVIVNGRLHTEEWEGRGGTHTSLVLEAGALGPDLTRGTATFTRAVAAVRSGDNRPEGSAPVAETDACTP